MKLLISIGTLCSGGAERVISILSKRFVEEFKEVEILMWYDRPLHYDIDKRIKLVYLSRYSRQNNRYRNIPYFRKYVKQSNPDIILSFLTPFNMLVLLATIGLDVKTIVCERNDPHFIPGGKLMEFIRNSLYRLADGALVQTKYGLECYPSYIRKKMSVIYNPVIMPEKMIGIASQTIKEDKFVAIGRLDVQKNHKMLLKAFQIFHHKYPNYKLVIYGEGAMRAETEALIEKLNLQNAVMLPGNCKDIWNQILTAKAFLLSSTAEGMSNALIESMCLGLPAISTKVSGSTDIIVDGKNGFLVDLNDSLAFAEKMYYFAQNNNASVIMGKQSAKLYDLLKYDIISNQWVDNIKQIVK